MRGMADWTEFFQKTSGPYTGIMVAGCGEIGMEHTRTAACSAHGQRTQAQARAPAWALRSGIGKAAAFNCTQGGPAAGPSRRDGRAGCWRGGPARIIHSRARMHTCALARWHSSACTEVDIGRGLSRIATT